MTIHPFDDGNGRIARAIADMVLARSENSAQRFYSMSAQIRQERKAYYDILEATQKGELDITPWLEWFLDCLEPRLRRGRNHSGRGSQEGALLGDACGHVFNDRQRTDHQSAAERLRRQADLVQMGEARQMLAGHGAAGYRGSGQKDVLVKDAAGGRSTSYSLAEIA